MARRKPGLPWMDRQRLSRIVNDRGHEEVAGNLQISTTTLARWCAGIVGPVGYERERLDALFAKARVKS